MEIKLFAFAALMAASVLTACGGTGKSVAGYGAQHEWYDDDNGETEKTLGLRNFNGIKSSMCVDVRYTQGSGYKVVARGTSRALSFADISVEDGLIYVRWKDSFSGTYRTGVDERITLFVTAPKFEKFESNGSMTFTTGTYKVDELDIDNKGGFDLKCGDIIGKSAGAKATISSGGRITITAGRISLGGLDVASSGALELSNEGLTAHDVKFSNYGRMTYSGDVKAGNVVIESSGASDITAGFDVSGNYTFKNSGGMTFNGNISAKNVDIDNYSACDISSEVKADMMDCSNGGRCNGSVSFTGGTLNLDCSGAGDFDVRLDCREVKAQAYGRLHLTLSGTADNVDLSGSGVSEINTSGLNKF